MDVLFCCSCDHLDRIDRQFWQRALMAQRFGGEHSPENSPNSAAPPLSPQLAANKFRGRKVHNPNIRSKLLFLAPLPLLFSGIGELRAGDAAGAVAELGALVVLLLAAWLLRDGLVAEEAYNARKVARPPAIPRKIFASVLTGLGVAIAAYGGWKQGLPTSLVFGALAAAAHSFSFGLDPLRKKGMEGVSDYETERVAKAVEKAERLVAETVAASKRIKDRALQGRVEALAQAARDMFRAVEEDPRDLSGARKFLSVYLKGARDATIKYADLAAKADTPKDRANYEALLADLEGSFNAQRETMLLDHRTDLTVEIEVLRDRLKQEGLKAKV